MKKYFFKGDKLPENYFEIVSPQQEKFPIGLTAFEDVFSEEELQELERCVEETEAQEQAGLFLPNTSQKTLQTKVLKRTKLFFNYRYLFTGDQLGQEDAQVAAGIRSDVSPAPAWMRRNIEQPLVDLGIVKENFFNSFALNVYHDGSEGLAQHFDDAARFAQPIYTLRLFSDSRLSFGNQFYGFCNGQFFVPLPRGCVLVMEHASFAANGVKHCVRPCDMMGKSAAVILRHIHQKNIDAAEQFESTQKLKKREAKAMIK